MQTPADLVLKPRIVDRQHLHHFLFYLHEATNPRRSGLR